jgi:hypothetical protein
MTPTGKSPCVTRAKGRKALAAESRSERRELMASSMSLSRHAEGMVPPVDLRQLLRAIERPTVLMSCMRCLTKTPCATENIFYFTMLNSAS